MRAAAVYLAASNRQPVADLLVAAWVLHYAHRTLVWPWIVQRRSRPMPIGICISSFVFNIINGLLVGWHLGHVADYPGEWLLDPRFIAGAALFLLGAAVNVASDYQVTRLREAQQGRYVIPRGGAFRFLSGAEPVGRDCRVDRVRVDGLVRCRRWRSPCGRRPT